MTSKLAGTSARDVSSLMNFVQPKNGSAPNGTTEAGGFGSAMNRAADRINKEPMPAKVESPNKPPVDRTNETTAQTEAGSAAMDKSRETVASTKEQPIDAKTAKQLEAAGEEAVKAVAEELGLSEEEVLAAMEEMGLVPLSLLEPRNLTSLVLQLTGEDSAALMTNEALYGQLSNLTAAISELTGELMNQTGMDQAQLAALLEQAKAAQLSAETGVLTKDEGFISPNAQAEMEAATAEPDKEITIVVEKDGVVTEITASADEDGNLQATKEVVTTVTDNASTSTGQDGSNQQQSDQSSDQAMNGRNAMLDNLLQNRTNATTTFNPVMSTMAAPDTEQIMRQILDYMKVSLKPEMNRLEMQLNPENLGTVHVEIASKEGVVTAQFTAQNDLVKATIESQLIELKENLRAQGIKVEAVEVNVQSQAFDSQLWQGNDGNDQGYQDNKHNRRRINLNELDLEELPGDMTAEEKMATEIMVENGNTVDMTA
ncbi:MAG: flagellar hook-length control protein FliK [Lachnospiraceae bacterium]|jgi:flagellar hook-length control protein FliK|nr:flagellar hook-length control protein FliK [Lachnospiraceae bacterium]